MYERALVIINPASGRHDAAHTRAVLEERFERAGLAYEIRETAAAGDALGWAAAAARDGFDLVVISAGDGTVMEAVTGIIQSGVAIPLAQIPVGTANLLARALAIPIDPRDAVETVFTGRPQRFDVGYLPDEDRYFGLVAGAGYDARLIRDASRNLKNILGYGAYVLTGIKNVFKLRRVRIDMEIDGERRRFRAHTVMIINSWHIGDGKIQIGPAVHPHDGRLDLMILSAASLAGAIRVFWQVMTKRYTGNPGLRYLTASSVRVVASPDLPTQVDGDALGRTPLHARIVPGGALFIASADYEPAPK